MGEEKEREKLPIDAKLLADAVIELNISRRSVGLYPREHPITRESIEKAYGFLKRLFEIRSSISLGIAKDTLVIDEYALERKNPVFREFALSIHRKGIASITFYSGLTMEELLIFHELITSKDVPVGKALMEHAGKKQMRHIGLTPLDISQFSFIEDRLREGGSDVKVWEDYIYGLLEGRLADSDAEGLILSVPPEHIALFIEERLSEDAAEETYDKVITTYLRRKTDSVVNKDIFNRFVTMVQNLSPNMKQQFLRHAFSHPAVQTAEAERLIGGLTNDDIEKMMKLFSEHSSLIPESLRNVVDKLAAAKKGDVFFDRVSGGQAFVDDVQIDESVIRLFGDDHFRSFVADGYREELERMLRGAGSGTSPLPDEVKEECNAAAVDRVVSEVMLEILSSDSVEREQYLGLLTKLSGLVNDFLDSGRFLEISDIYNTLYSHALAGRFREEASSMIEYFFASDASIAKFIDSFKLWGRFDREGVVRLATVLKRYLKDPLLDALSAESDPAIRKFILYVLSQMRSDVLPEALRRLNDERWYVVRNMIYLIRECDGRKYVDRVKPFVKHKDKRIRMETVKTLVYFQVPGASSYVKLHLRSKDPDLRDHAVRLAGTFRMKETVPYLIELIERKDPLGTEVHNKMSVVKTLGEIGDPKAIESLSRLYQSRSLLYRGLREELKVEIFKSLKNYPLAATRQLLELGLESKNKEVRAIAEEILKAKGEEDESGKGC